MKTPHLVASTDSTYNQPLPPTPTIPTNSTNYFKSLHFSPDGTTLLTTSASNTLSTFILPPTLLTSSSPHTLKPYTTLHLPEPPYSTALHPSYTLSHPPTCLTLTSLRDHPTRLINLLSPHPILATYPLISPTTEAYETPHSLLFTRSGTTFFAGTTSQISLFDLERNGEAAVHTYPTIPSKRHKSKGGGVGMRGIVSALALSSPTQSLGNGILAAGTWTRWIGLYDSGGCGGTISNFCVEEAAREAGVGGKGISQVEWSGCGRYLLVAERCSSGVLVYDVRVQGKLCGWLEGREAGTNQRIGVDVFEGRGGCEVWGGGVDGNINVWEGVGRVEGGMGPSWGWRGHGDAVSGVGVHGCGGVVATCSGQRRELFDVGEGSGEEHEGTGVQGKDNSVPKNMTMDSEVDNSLKIWSLYDIDTEKSDETLEGEV